MPKKRKAKKVPSSNAATLQDSAEETVLDTAAKDHGTQQEKNEQSDGASAASSPSLAPSSSPQPQPSPPPPPPPPPVPAKSVMDMLVERVAVTDLRPSDWVSEHYKVLQDFITDHTVRAVYIYKDVYRGFCVEITVPPFKVGQLFYFLKVAQVEALTTANLMERIQYGSMQGDYLKSLLRIMTRLHCPQFFYNPSWTESLRNDFSEKLHRFMSGLTDTRWKIDGKTVLYIPYEGVESPIDVSADDKEYVQRMEVCVIHWSRQIKQVLNIQSSEDESAESGGPLAEVDHWKNRCADLLGITSQLDQPPVVRIIQILKTAKSNYISPFLKLSEEIQEGCCQAESNVRFLMMLKEPCHQLLEAIPPEIPALLPRILNLIRIIWVNSEYYRSREQLTGLLKKVSNQVISRCCAYISLDRLFDGYIASSRKNLQQCIECCQSWQDIYHRGLGGVHLLYGLAGGRVSLRGVDLLSCCAVVDVRVDDPRAVSAALRSERGDGCEAGPAGRQRSAQRSVPAGLTMRELVMAIAAMFRAVGCDPVAGAVVLSSPVVTATIHQKFSEEEWKLDENNFFSQVEAFVQRCNDLLERCKDLLEVCDAQQHFARFVEGDQTPLPQFWGHKGLSLACSLQNVENQYFKNLGHLRRNKKTILDVKSTTWHSDYTKFCDGIKDLEVMTQNVLINAFNTVMSVQKGIEILDVFMHLQCRELMRRSLEKKTVDVYALFVGEINAVKNLISYKSKLQTFAQPKYAGTGHWARFLRKRLEKQMMYLDQAFFLPVVSNIEEIRDEYAGVVVALDETIRKTNYDWTITVDKGESLSTSMIEANLSESLNTSMIEANLSESLNTSMIEANLKG
ncbi:hypothetical protein ACOMHN_031731 [Nucella lapillus]